MRLDGLASARAEYEGGELLTKPITFAGKHLSINFATSAPGGIRIEIQGVDGKALPGFALADCREQIGNEIERIVSWKRRRRPIVYRRPARPPPLRHERRRPLRIPISRKVAGTLRRAVRQNSND